MRNAGSLASGLKMGPILAPRQAGALSAGTAAEQTVRIPRLCLTRAGHYHGCRVAVLPSAVAGTNLDESRLCL